VSSCTAGAGARVALTDTLLGQLMEPMMRWTITSVVEEVGGIEGSEEESTSSESEEVIGRCE